MSDTPEVKLSSALDFTAAYKVCSGRYITDQRTLTVTVQKYTITRKMPMLVARQERILAIDGVYIHVCVASS